MIGDIVDRELAERAAIYRERVDGNSLEAMFRAGDGIERIRNPGRVRLVPDVEREGIIDDFILRAMKNFSLSPLSAFSLPSDSLTQELNADSSKSTSFI